MPAMVWSEPLMSMRQTHALYGRLCGYGTVSEADVRVLTASIDFTSPLIIRRTLNFLQELGLVRHHDDGFEAIIGRIDEATFRARLTAYLEQLLVSDVSLIGEAFQVEGIYGTLDDGSLQFWKSYVPKDYRALVPQLVEAGLIGQDNGRRTLLLPASGLIARHFMGLPHEQIRQMSLTRLLADLEQKRMLGLKAEEAAIRYETARLRKLGDMRDPQRISDLFTNAGYDIVSYVSKSSTQPDKLIEVKAITGTEHFFMSRNEVLVAQQNRNAYSLYLVRIMDDGRQDEVEIIEDPYQHLMQNEDEGWVRSVESYRFERI